MVMAPNPAISEQQPSVTSAVERMLSASQQLVVDRMELVILEAKEVLTRGLLAAVVAGIALGAFFCGWLFINASLAIFFQETVSLSTILAGLAAINAGIGALAVLAARKLLGASQKTASTPN